MTLAITATFTAEALEPALSFWIRELGFDAAIRFTGYGQVFQELLDPGGAFARNTDGVNVALVRFRTSTGGAIFTIMRRNDGKLHYYNEITGAGVPRSQGVAADGLGLHGRRHGCPN